MTLAPEVSSKEPKIVRGACPHDCPDTCAMLYQVRAARGIATSDLVQVFNDRGSFQGPAQLDAAVLPGLVMANVGHWPSSSPGNSSVNSITSDSTAPSETPVCTQTTSSR